MLVYISYIYNIVYWWRDKYKNVNITFTTLYAIDNLDVI